MKPDQACEQLRLADELLGSLVGQLQSLPASARQCTSALREIVATLRAAQGDFSTADKPTVEELLLSIRTRTAQVKKLLDAAIAFRCNSLRMNSAGVDCYSPDGFGSYASGTRSFQLQA
jgi:hypothetical protein